MNIIFVGRLIFAKGVQDLILASIPLWRTGYIFKLVIVGGGNYGPELGKVAAKEINELWQSSRDRIFIRWTGELDHDEVMQTLRDADIFVNPSYSEGLPTSVMEAASVGLPIIATDVGGTNEIIADNKTGLLYEAGNVVMLTRLLKYLIDNPDRMRYFGDKAKETVAKKFDWEEIANQYDRLLREVGR